MRGPLFTLPTAFFLGILFFVLILFLFIFVQVGIVTVAFAKLGLTAWQAFGLLLAVLIGSGINIPVYRSEMIVPNVSMRRLRFFSSRDLYRAESERPELVHQIVAVNFGGCVIPALISFSLMARVNFNPGMLASLVIVSVVCYKLARPVSGVGIAIPLLIPPLVTAFAVLFLVPAEIAPHSAYIAGSLGTLIGADLMHLASPSSRRHIDAPLVSIGGAGTFDGIFITGILAVLLA